MPFISINDTQVATNAKDKRALLKRAGYNCDPEMYEDSPDDEGADGESLTDEDYPQVAESPLTHHAESVPRPAESAARQGAFHSPLRSGGKGRAKA